MDELKAMQIMECGLVLDGTNVVYDEDAEFFEDSIPMGRFIQDISAGDASVQILNFQGAILQTSGLKRVNEILQLLPNVTFLNLYGSDIGCDLNSTEDVHTLFQILATFDHLVYVDIVGSGLANQILPFLAKHPLDPPLDLTIRSKLIFSFETLLDSKLPHDPIWHQTHRNYYKSPFPQIKR